uniref:Uncharacterized protein n=1 Tax=Globisporangium ultimum (strain ATCC 200006 / CBS 805.95 / DAOM BR144) TaxID=431595 RepID=K3X8F6_GLOUD
PCAPKQQRCGVKSHERGPQPKSSRAPWRVLDRAHVPAQALQRVDVTAPLVGDPARDAVAMHRGVRAAGLRPIATPKRGLAI